MLAGFKEERPGLSPRGVHETEIEFTHFIELFTCEKSRKCTTAIRKTYFRKPLTRQAMRNKVFIYK